ncbi:uncharacterized protein AMSG_11508 [Thecamonas trahens ATCC 50062]|uniref:Arginyl-tRNA--protein transferase 1 n=1 Tax=Thecamonas trahens ATCC 50062 TaxID=461836 RepID=A0A0L0DW93_THETB|nr:hypothetical protein AMSG_11508 [Thecamonas trahens ATCC 50062]KNC56490.1 hypothetical protein AMSG_11508 [Thecamonas trahens ATCC 50062]|eukprot:XP_013752635.1 hypothetical protein AMSG_11508 [Thecamonas trahens ATCC 50062]
MTSRRAMIAVPFGAELSSCGYCKAKDAETASAGPSRRSEDHGPEAMVVVEEELASAGGVLDGHGDDGDDVDDGNGGNGGNDGNSGGNGGNDGDVVNGNDGQSDDGDEGEGESKRMQDGMWPVTCEAEDYQELIDRGWRRSGYYCYRPHVTPDVCCKLYTIRARAADVFATRSQRKKMARFVRGVAGPARPGGAENEEEEEEEEEVWPPPPARAACPSRPRALAAAGLRLEFVLSRDGEVHGPTHALYRKYQMAVHGSKENEVSEAAFERFLVSSPIRSDAESSHPGFAALCAAWPPPYLSFCTTPPTGYGSYHMRWWLGEELIAVSVLDVLPACLSSVYFFYDPDQAHLSLGVVSAEVEILLTAALSAHLPSLKYYYLGYYVDSCPKMQYKGEYKPFELLCPATLTWVGSEAALPVVKAAEAGESSSEAGEPIRLAADGVASDDPLELMALPAKVVASQVFSRYVLGRASARYEDLSVALRAALAAEAESGELSEAELATIDECLR